MASPIALTNPGTQTATEGTAITSVALSASYSGGGSLTYSAVGLPAGLQLNPSTGVISGTPAAQDAAAGPYTVTVQAAAASATDEQTFTWNINSPITLALPAEQTNNEGDTVSLALSASDAIGDATLSYSATGLPAGLAIGTSSGVISGTVALGDAAGGPYAVTVMAQDGMYSTAQTFNWNVNCPLTLAGIADQTNNEGDTVSLALSASDSIVDSTVTYGALGLPTGLNINPTTGAITGTIVVGAALDGPYSVSVVAEDGTYSSEQSFTWNINSPVNLPVPNDQDNNPGDAVSLPLQATDALVGATLTYAASGLPTGLSLNTTTGVISGTPTYGGTWEPTVSASDGTYSNTQTFEWDVNSLVSITDPGAQANITGDTVSLALAASDAAFGTLSYSASGLPGGLTINSTTGLISGTVSSGDAASSPYAPTVTVSDGTNTAVDTFAWTVTGPVAVTNPGSLADEAGDNVLFQVQATDSVSGTLTYTASGLPNGLYMNPATGWIAGTISAGAAAGSPYSVTVGAGDGTNSDSQTFTWTVSAAGPVQLTYPGSPSNNEGDAIALSLAGSDSSAGTLSYTAFGLPAGLAINPASGAITGTMALGDAAGGPYSVTVTANDGTNSAVQSFNWNVNDPVTLAAVNDQTNNESDTVSLALSANDAAAGTLSYAALGLPGGLSINPTSGAITGDPGPGRRRRWTVQRHGRGRGRDLFGNPDVQLEHQQPGDRDPAGRPDQ